MFQPTHFQPIQTPNHNLTHTNPKPNPNPNPNPDPKPSASPFTLTPTLARPWVDMEEGNKFSNEYAADMIEDEWRLVDHSDTWLDAIGAAELRPAPGNRQYVNQKPVYAHGEKKPPNQVSE